MYIYTSFVYAGIYYININIKRSNVTVKINNLPYPLFYL